MCVKVSICLLIILESFPLIVEINHKQSLKGFGSQGGTPYNGLYREALPERDTIFRLQVYKRVGISQGLGIYKGREIGHLGI